MNSLIDHRIVRLSRPDEHDRRAFDQRLADALGEENLEIPLSVTKRLRDDLFGNDIACVVGRIANRRRLIDIGTERSFSVALDLGSTNLVGVLYDNRLRADVLTRSIENPQIAYGSDILTRMHHVLSGNAAAVYQALHDGVGVLIARLCSDAGIDPRAIHAVSAAGNTVMSHFFLGLDISSIPVEPFAPVVRTPGFFSAAELSLAINPEAPVYVFPNAGSYVGGDITAGILASGMAESDDISILIDVGTNAEVVIGNREWLIVGAGAAGPALEEGISRAGKRASTGIIYDVEIRGTTVGCKTFDRGNPEGICGSGMVSLLYELYRAGIIDQSGSLRPGPLVMKAGEEPAFFLAGDCASSLFVTQSEIQNFMKSKAAMFTLLLVLVRSVGISFKDIRSVFVSGALGTGIDSAKAAGVGMLPSWPQDRVKPLGNSSLRGARMLLEDATVAPLADALVQKITYKHMHDDPEFMKEFLGAVFLPHTDPELLKT